MRVIGDIPHAKFKITLFQWNGKYIMKFETGMCEQTYKFSEMDVYSEADVRKVILNNTFMEQVEKRFESMHNDLYGYINQL